MHKMEIIQQYRLFIGKIWVPNICSMIVGLGHSKKLCIQKVRFLISKKLVHTSSAKGLFGYRLFYWKLKTYCWKHCSKIIFKLWIILWDPQLTCLCVFFEVWLGREQCRGTQKKNTKRLIILRQTHAKNQPNYCHQSSFKSPKIL